jgi:hypothetical protein
MTHLSSVMGEAYTFLRKLVFVGKNLLKIEVEGFLE